MKRSIFFMAALLGLASMANAETIVDGVSVGEFGMERAGEYFVVDMNMNLSELDVNSNRAVLLTPRLVNGPDTLDLPAVGVYGRRRYYYYMRNGESMLADQSSQSFRANKVPDSLAYHNIVPFEEWMDASQLLLHRRDYGCCNNLLREQWGVLGRIEPEFFPTLVYVQPQAERQKSRSLEGSAYIDFPVDQTIIYPEYRNNVAELNKIHATIDSVRNDRDVTITQVWLKGFASPESPYEHNTELAMGRTAALKEYIRKLYHFDERIIVTDYEPENWEGLRKYVEASTISHRTEILRIIDLDRKPDPKEWILKSTYPQEYRYLLANCYPALRRTDYRIAYTIRGYSDVEEIKEILETRPQKLSLNEFYLVAQTYEPGSDEFAEVFETAVRMYPADEVANLNAANAAMRRNDFTRAKRYLAKAGDSPEAIYARGAYAYMVGNIDLAEELFERAHNLGIDQAAETLEGLKQRRK